LLYPIIRVFNYRKFKKAFLKLMEMEKKRNSVLYAVETYGLKSFLRNVFSIAISGAAAVSFQKSGRTWLRLMLGKVLSRQYGIKEIRLDTEYMTLFKPVHNILFSHAGCTKKDNKLNFQKIFRNKKLVLLVRDPRAVMVSLFHDHTKRNLWYEGNNQSEFIRDRDWGLAKLIKFMNGWAEEVKKRKEGEVLMIKYEGLYTNTAGELKKFLDFLGIKYTEDMISEAVQYGSVNNMRKMELAGTFKDRRMRPADIRDQQSYRTRKCKLGSFREELSKGDLDYIDEELRSKLNPMFGYNYEWRDF